MASTLTPILNKLKFPIQKAEFPKFMCIAMMLVFTVYIYSILRNTKDSLLLSHLGAELISTTKLWSVLPSAVLFMLLYTKLANIASRTNLYNYLIWFFIGFFVIFNFLLYPNLDHLLLNMDGAIQKLPYMKYILQMIAGWPIVLFYILSELWGSAMLALMFWQLANQIISIPEAKRFYPLFLLVGQVGLLISGFFSLFSSKQHWQTYLNTMTITLIIAGIGLSFCLSLLSKLVGKDTINDTTKGSHKKSKVRLGFTDSLKYVFSSKYIGLIALLIICYGISINLVEGVWKASIKLHFAGDKGAIQSFFGNIQIWTAVIGIIAMYSGSYLLRVMKWRSGALLTPIVILVTGVLFYIFMIYQDGTVIAPIILTLGTTPLFLAVTFGGAQNVLSKATKYSFFDPTKEMAYIPLDEELKSKGKAAADVIGGRLGKSMGAAVQWGLLQIGYMFNPNISLLSLASSFFVIFSVVLILWFISVYSLEKKFNKKTQDENRYKEKAATLST